MLYFTIFLVIIFLMYLYTYGWLFGMPKLLRNVVQEKSVSCADVKRAEKEIQGFWNQFIGVTNSDILKEKRRLDC